MNIPCPYNQPCIDDANSLGNFSSETPDQDLFRSTYFPNQIFDGDDDIFTACFGLCVSTVSQEEADLCAQNNAKICERDKQYGNELYTCSKVCPDGATYSFTVPAGTFWSTESQAQANALAENWCSNYINELCESIPGPGNPNPGPKPNPNLPPSTKKDCNDALDVYLICPDGRRGWNYPACKIWADDKFAANKRARDIIDDKIDWALGCLNTFPKTACINDEIDRFIAPLFAPGVTLPVEWEVFGILPPALKTEPKGLALRVYGRFTQAGTFGFRATITDKEGIYSYRVYFISVMDIETPGALPAGQQGVAYSTTISVLGGWDPKVYTVKSTGGTLPPGLGLDASTGTISGTPTATGTYDFTVVVTDNEGGSCEKDFTIVITDNTFADFKWSNTTSCTGLGVCEVSPVGVLQPSPSAFGSASIPLLCSIAGTNAVARLQPGDFSIVNSTGAPLNCKLTVVVSKVNWPTPPSGIQSGSETIYFARTAPSSIVIANTGSGDVPPGTYEYNFTLPVGASVWTALFLIQASYSGSPCVAPDFIPYAGGSSTFSVSFGLA